MVPWTPGVITAPVWVLMLFELHYQPALGVPNMDDVLELKLVNLSPQLYQLFINESSLKLLLS